jgi:hypothetical protein
MAKFLTTTSISHLLEEIIKKATKNLILVSPVLVNKTGHINLLISRNLPAINHRS